MSTNELYTIVVAIFIDNCKMLFKYRYQTNTANTMLATIVNIQPKDTAGSGGETRESMVYRLADDFLSKLPADYISHEVIVNLIEI